MAPGTAVSWAAFEAAAPDIAAVGRRLLRRGDGAEGLIATVCGEASPRIHPVTVGIVDGHLYVFVLPSAKRGDLELDGRFALHAHQDPVTPHEFSIRGRAVLVTDAEARDAAAARWPFAVDATYLLFELRVESAILGRRSSADAWPPHYSRWRSVPASA